MLVRSYQRSFLYEGYKMRCRATGVKIYGRWARKGHKESIFMIRCPIRDSWSCFLNHNYCIIINLSVIKLLIGLCIISILSFEIDRIWKLIISFYALFSVIWYQTKNYNNLICCDITDCLTGQTVIKIL